MIWEIVRNAAIVGMILSGTVLFGILLGYGLGIGLKHSGWVPALTIFEQVENGELSVQGKSDIKIETKEK